jgi:hypothetical protein
MTRILCLSILIACSAFADDAADRAAITRVILDSAPQLKLKPPSVEISHEPWGEATIHLPPVATGILIGPIRFVTSDVAIADAVAQTTPVLFVMKKDRGVWKIETMRILAMPPG